MFFRLCSACFVYFQELSGRGSGNSRARFLPSREILRRDRALFSQIRRGAKENDFSAALAGSRADVEDAVGGEHDLRVVLDHHQRVARVAQPLHHVDHAAHVARMQANGRLVQHEQRVDERGAERGGEVDALHFAARERARLAVQGQVAQAHVAEELQPRADLGEQEIRGLIEGGRKLQFIENGSRFRPSAGASGREWTSHSASTTSHPA